MTQSVWIGLKVLNWTSGLELGLLERDPDFGPI